MFFNLCYLKKRKDAICTKDERIVSTRLFIGAGARDDDMKYRSWNLSNYFASLTSIS